MSSLARYISCKWKPLLWNPVTLPFWLVNSSQLHFRWLLWHKWHCHSLCFEGFFFIFLFLEIFHVLFRIHYHYLMHYFYYIIRLKVLLKLVSNQVYKQFVWPMGQSGLQLVLTGHIIILLSSSSTFYNLSIYYLYSHYSVAL